MRGHLFLPAIAAGMLLGTQPAANAAELMASVNLRGTVPAEGQAEVARVVIDDADVPPEPEATVIARVDLSDQRMYVYVANRLVHTWKVSTGRGRYITPTGKYKPEWMTQMWRSRKYHYAPMPWSVFFHEGYAIHGTTDLRNLGRPASHGCVRLHPDDAKSFFKLVAEYGKQSTMITVVR